MYFLAISFKIELHELYLHDNINIKIHYYVTFSLTLVTNDNATYKVQEYFSYNQNSYYDLECDLEQHQLEQPSPTKD